VTNICGLSCSFCPPKTTPNTTMSKGFFEKILSELAPYTQELSLHVMGDPLSLSNLADYLDIAHQKNFRVMLTTSGFLIPHHPADTLFHPAIRQLNISLNSYNKNTTRLTPDAYFGPIIALCHTKIREFPAPFVNLRLWNLDEAGGDAEYNRSVFARLYAAFGTTLEATLAQTPGIKSIRLASKVLLHFERYFQWPSLQNPPTGDGACGGLISQIAILSNGDVVPCCLDGEGVMALGNLSDTPLAAVLAAPRAQAIISGFQNQKAAEELCRRCSYKSRFAD
jgi:radical SAM protein with 4Fe4S-binding SPASM domain